MNYTNNNRYGCDRISPYWDNDCFNWNNCNHCNHCNHCCCDGRTGATGATGTTGTAVAAGAIIPFASGLPVELKAALPVELKAAHGCRESKVALIGFGTAATTEVVLGDDIDLTGAALLVPRTGTITSMAAFFSTISKLYLIVSTVTIKAQLYRSAGPTLNNIFKPIPGAVVTLVPSLTGVLQLGHVSSGIKTGLNIPVNIGDRLLLVFDAEVTSFTAVTEGIELTDIMKGFVITGYASAGVEID